ncbi:MAG TPA: GatB/YqeY domain-containing protein, partial [Patescibacteria group bacterium]|nr:GatB/YqeY domain-containing protein [Patescibacteria group bacterium]
MAISEKLEADIITAMKAGDAFDVTTMRMLKAAILNKEIASRPKKLTEDDVVAVTQTEVKKRKEAAVEFTKGN